MNIVSDTSALSNLAVIDQLSILKEVYHQIIIPQAVPDLSFLIINHVS